MRHLIHNLTHSHTFAEKEGVGQVVLCIHRITGRNDVHVTVGDECWYLRNVTVEQLRELVTCETAADLRIAAIWQRRARGEKAA